MERVDDVSTMSDAPALIRRETARTDPVATGRLPRVNRYAIRALVT